MEAIDFFVEHKAAFIIVHVCSVIVGMGSALVSDILFNFYSKGKKLSNKEITYLERLSRTIWISLVVIILSGVALFFSDPEKYMHSDKFISKMFIMLVLLVNGLLLSKFVSPHFHDRGLLKFKNERTVRQFAFICGAISIVSWSVVCVLGVLKSIPIHFTQFLAGYVVLIACSAFVSLLVEKKAFSSN